jgi:putative acetyltransferase
MYWWHFVYYSVTLESRSGLLLVQSANQGLDMKDLRIRILQADLDDPRIVELIENHVVAARGQTASGSAHALDLSGLRSSDVSVWVADRGEDIVGTGALKRLSEVEGEVKSMYTSPSARRLGVASIMLNHIIDAARNEGLRRLNLETGSWPYFDPARALYAAFGFVECDPFGEYREDTNSVFMTLNIENSLARGSSRTH